MSEQSQPQLSHDQLFNVALRRFNEFDDASIQLREVYGKLRMRALLLALLTTFIATLSVYLRSIQALSPFADLSFRFMLVAFPILSITYLSLANEFASSTGWVEYRYAAEILRSAIMRYRLRLNPQEVVEQRAQLNRAIGLAEQHLNDNPPTVPLSLPQATNSAPPKNFSERLDAAWDKFWHPFVKFLSAGLISDPPTDTPNTTWLSTMSMADYISNRAENQLAWYKMRITQDYQKRRGARFSVLFVAAIGSAFAVLGNGLEGFVAAFTALSTYLNARSDTLLYGRTFQIFQQAANQLEAILREKWFSLTDEERALDEKQRAFVEAVEAAISDEGKRWREAIVQVLQNNERALAATIRYMTQSAPSAAQGMDTLEKQLAEQDKLKQQET